jgi:hypothetical protein
MDAEKSSSLATPIGSVLEPTASTLVARSLDHSSSHPLPPGLITHFRPRLPTLIDSVRVHRGAEASSAADALRARAFATGTDIVFGANQFAPQTRGGRNLISHELAHVSQQRSVPSQGARLIQRRDQDSAVKDDADNEDVEVIAAEEAAKYRWIDYRNAALLNRKWFGLLHLDASNPLIPFNPVDTPNAFINRMVEWQLAVHRDAGGGSFAQFIFAAAAQQAKVREPAADTILNGISDVAEKVRAGTFEPGSNVDPDGVLGPSTVWTMLVAKQMSAIPSNREILRKANIPVAMLSAEWSDSEPSGQTVRAVHAFEFNKPHFKATWTTIVQADTVVGTFEELNELPPGDVEYLTELFFDGQLPQTPEIGAADLLAILARGYRAEALEVVVSLVEVDRRYISDVDVERLELQKTPGWRTSTDLRMAVTKWQEAQKLLQQLELVPPQTAAAKAALARLQDSDGNPAQNEPMSWLVVAARLPDKDEQFWKETARKYVDEKVAVEQAAKQATADYLAGLEKTYKERMEGVPDMQKSDAPALVELLTGDAFESAQKAVESANSKPVPGVRITQELQPSTAGDKAAKLYALAQQNQYLIVQLGDDKESRFPLSLRQIDKSRAAARVNGRNPLLFDFIDTPHAAFHYYTPHRFTARKTEKGAEVGSNPYELSEAPDALSYERWQGRITQHYDTFEPVLIEVNEFNADANFLFRAGRQLFGTDRLGARYFWTLGGSLPSLSEQLWSGQGKINFMGWVDAVMTVFALASLIEAPLTAGLEAEGSTAAAELGQAAINAAMRKALYIAVKKFVISEAVAQGLNWASDYINKSPDIPQSLKSAWNGFMIALMVYGFGKMAREGIKAFRNAGTPDFRAHIAQLEQELETGLRSGETEVSSAQAAAEATAEAEVEQATTGKFKEVVGPEAPSGAGRVRSDDPRAAGITTPPEATLSVAEKSELRNVLGQELAGIVEGGLEEPALKRLANLKDPNAIRKLAQALKPKQLGRVLAAVESDVLAGFAVELEGEALTKLLQAFAGRPAGVRLMSAFAKAPQRLSVLLGSFDGENLMSLAQNPGAERLFLVAAEVEPAILANALQNMGAGTAGSMQRFRNLLEAVGPERTAQVLNTYTPGEMGDPRRWRSRGAVSAPQNLTALAIKRGGPTESRLRLGAVAAQEARPTLLAAKDFRSFFAVGLEATAPPRVRQLLNAVQTASAAAANRLEELIARANKGMLTNADLQALPPNARATIAAFAETGPKSPNRDALYGSALQYLTEQELIKAFGGQMPPGMVFRRPEVRGRRTLIPDMQLEVDLPSEMRFPGKNKAERVVFDWTTAGEAGKISKYAGGKPPVTWGIEVIHPGPSPALQRPSSLPAVIPRKIGDPTAIDTPPLPAPTQIDDPTQLAAPTEDTTHE